jgi:4-carboxymuconolactone decarboxylase
MSEAISLARRLGIGRTALYEVVLQSYLFLGFPRMLGAGEALATVWPQPNGDSPYLPDLAIQTWSRRGEKLYRTVYGDNSHRLQDRVRSFAPEIFDWMVVEGYGKVLSRPQLDIVLRELSIVAFLMIDNRPRQLMSHLRGAIRVGAKPAQVVQAIEDLREVAAPAYPEARQILSRLGIA